MDEQIKPTADHVAQDVSKPRAPIEAEPTTGQKVVAGVGAVAHGVGWVVMKAYAVVLIILGIMMLAQIEGGARFVGLAVIAYGLYLLLPGSKFVVW